jgi:hypothetical protein
MEHLADMTGEELVEELKKSLDAEDRARPDPAEALRRGNHKLLGSHRLRRYLPCRGGSYCLTSGTGSRTGSGLSFARIAFKVMMRGDRG